MAIPFISDGHRVPRQHQRYLIFVCINVQDRFPPRDRTYYAEPIHYPISQDDDDSLHSNLLLIRNQSHERNSGLIFIYMKKKVDVHFLFASG